MLVTLLWLVLFASLVPVARYTRASLAKATLVLRGAARLLHAVRGRCDLVEGDAVGPFRPARPPEHPPLAARPDLEPVPAGLQADAAAHVHDRARGARGRHGLVGRRALHRRPGLAQSSCRPRRRHSRRKSRPSSTGPARELCRDDRRLGHHAPARRPSARSLRLHQEEGLLGDDHPEEVRRARVLRLRALHRRREDREPLEHRRPRPSSCRTRSARPSCCCTTAPRSRRSTSCRGSRAARRSPASRLTGPARRLRCRLDAATRGIVVPRPVPGPRESLGIRLNFSKRYITLAPIATDHRPRVPPVRPRAAASAATRPTTASRSRWCRAIRRHHDRPPPLPAEHPVPERPDRRARTCSCRSTRSSAGRRWRARAGACWSNSSRSAAASRCRRIATGGAKAAVYATGAYARIRRQFNLPVGKFEGVEAVIARMAGTHLHHGCRALGDDRRDRRRREACRARRRS